MSHVQLLKEAQPIFDANPDGGAYIITSSITVCSPKTLTIFVADLSAQGITQTGSSLPYSVTKAAGLQLMKCLAGTQGPKIRMNAILPGQLLTDWVSILMPMSPICLTKSPKGTSI